METDQALSTAKNLTTGNKILGGSAAAAIVAVNLSWYKIDGIFGGGYSGISGRRFTFGWMGALLLAVAAGLVLAPAFGAKAVKTDSLETEQIALGAAGAGMLLWLIRLISVPGFGGVARSVGLFIAIAAAAGVVYGVIASMKEKNIAMPTVDDLKTITTASTASAQPMAATPAHPAPTHQPPAPAPVQQHAAPTHQPPAPTHQPPAAAPVQQHAAPTHQPPAPGTVSEF